MPLVLAIQYISTNYCCETLLVDFLFHCLHCQADWMADWMAAGGTAVLVPAGQVSIAQAPQARKESVWKERAQACGSVLGRFWEEQKRLY